MSKKLDDIKRQSEEIETATWNDFWGNVAECSDILKKIDPIARRPPFPEVIQDLHRKQGGLCALCGERVELGTLHVDHIIPVSYAGGNESANLQITCPNCNWKKRNKVDPWDLLRYIEGKYQNRP
jgi:5-methylcytosine-specific restriction endonuclease McrA